MRARAVMVLGTTSGAGKSWLSTALCRWYARRGLTVAPFKAQNMSNNARVVPTLDGRLGEIGSAQYFQALAARARPDVRMNPILLKPEKETASQVIVMGEVREDLYRMPWRERSASLWPHAEAALRRLMDENDVVVLEGAGSPAEINLHANDYVNMRSALAARAACLLVTDIDRGGAFAHLYGTHQLLPEHERVSIRGFVLNRFRGDASLLAPGPRQLQELTGVPTLAVLPMWRGHGLPEEDGVFDDRPTGPASATTPSGDRVLRVALIAFPRISNLDEFQSLRGSPNVRLVWAREPADLHGADWVILPGSKQTAADLAWLRSVGLDAAVVTHAREGRAVLGICGGMQMLGDQLLDPHGVESSARAPIPGLGLIDVETRFEKEKLLRETLAVFGGPAVCVGPWAALTDCSALGYEIHHGRTRAVSDRARPVLHDPSGHCIGWQQGPVMGLYLHGLFESEQVLQALLGQRASSLERVFDGLADFVDEHFEPGSLLSLLD